MATPTKEINQVIRVGNTLTNLIDKQTKQIFTADKVTTYYDGTPMTDAKVDGYIYRKAGSEYFLKNLGKYEELFLEKDTVAQLRDLSATEILLLKMGYYKGVTLNGYYKANDTPAPIQYYLSNTDNSDDGGSVFEVGGVKLECDFRGKVVSDLYFGIAIGVQFDIDLLHRKISKLWSCGASKIIHTKGYEVEIIHSLNLVNNDCHLEGNGFIIKQRDQSGMIVSHESLVNIVGSRVTVDGLIVNSNYDNNYVFFNGNQIKATIAEDFPDLMSEFNTSYIGATSLNITGSDVRVSNCKILGSSWTGISVGQWGSPDKIENVVIENNYVEHTFRDSYSIRSAKNCTFRNNVGRFGVHHHIHVYRNCDNIVVENNDLLNESSNYVAWWTGMEQNHFGGDAIVVDHQSYAEKCKNTIIKSNTIVGVGEEAFIIGITTQGYTQGVYIYDNIIENAVTGITIGSGNPTYGVIQNNIIRGGKNGVMIQTTFNTQTGGKSSPQISKMRFLNNIFDVTERVFRVYGNQQRTIEFYEYWETIIEDNNILGNPEISLLQEFDFPQSGNLFFKLNWRNNSSENLVNIINNQTNKTNSSGLSNIRIGDYYEVDNKFIKYTQSSVADSYYNICSFTINNSQRVSGSLIIFSTRMENEQCELAFFAKGGTILSTLSNTTNLVGNTNLVPENITWVKEENGDGSWTHKLYLKSTYDLENYAINTDNIFISSTVDRINVDFPTNIPLVSNLPTGEDITHITPTLRKYVNVGSSPDTATAPSATYDQAEVQAILTELRDLKTKMRAAGILAT